LANRLIERYNLRGKEIIEIGCGKGEFLTMICELGGNRGTGFDLSYDPAGRPQPSVDVEFVQDYYSETYQDYQADLILCRHVLEHIEKPIGFLRSLRRTMDDERGAIVYFEVPNVEFTLDGLAIWDIIYEHPSYFGFSSLNHAFCTAGFEVVELGVAYEGQFLYVEALPSHSQSVSEGHPTLSERLAVSVSSFGKEYCSKVETWRARFQRMGEVGQRAVVWGTGSKAVSFLNIFRSHGVIDYAVDINPHKHGRYVAGTGQEIVPPEFLVAFQPDVIIVMNPVYLKEIGELAAKLSLQAELVSAM
jgi:SAM-dependent methyltransferase